MTGVDTEFGFSAAVALRGRTAPLRLVLMGVVAVMIGTIGRWAWAPAWFAAYAGLQGLAGVVSLKASAPIGPLRRGLHCALATLSFAVAGLPTWHLWTRCGVLGVATAVMFLCGLLAQLIVGSLGARRLFWFSAAPLIAYLIVLPPLAWGGARLKEGLTVSACGLCVVAYLIALWSGYQKAMERAVSARAEADAARRDAERAARAKGAFLATMSHEVRTPMNAVLGAAELLRGTALDPVQVDYVQMISDAGSVLMTVLNDVLDLSKIEAGKFQIAPAPTDLHALVRRCGRLWRTQTQAAGLTFDARIHPDLPRVVEIDPERLSQILFNLLSNAVKFTAAGGVRLTVDAAPLAPEEAGGPNRVELKVTVTDTGRGIAPEALPRLFQAFEQADQSTSRQFGGTGLGLAISQRLAQLMGGQITVRSTLGQGSTFTLTLPARLGHEVAEAPAPPTPAPDAVRAGLRVLVAEDNPVNRKLVDAFLSPLQASVTFAHNGAEALQRLTTAPFDVVLMDIQMPVMDGLEATRRLRASASPNANLPVIALTANVMEDQCAAYRAAGMDAHVAKPINPERLLATIMDVVRAGREGGGANGAGAPARAG
jgi:signal transduction histidine kinase/ActR/RegA family two-component response regulator